MLMCISDILDWPTLKKIRAEIEESEFEDGRALRQAGQTQFAARERERAGKADQGDHRSRAQA